MRFSAKDLGVLKISLAIGRSLSIFAGNIMCLDGDGDGYEGDPEELVVGWLMGVSSDVKSGPESPSAC